MAAPETSQDTRQSETPHVAAVFDGTQARESPAWEQIEAGRYRPRRIRGSCRGRELG
jgi:hypothetical protein